MSKCIAIERFNFNTRTLVFLLKAQPVVYKKLWRLIYEKTMLYFVSNNVVNNAFLWKKS